MTKLPDLEKKFSVRSTDDFNAISLSRQKLLDKLEKTREDNLTEMNLYISGAKKPTFDTIEKLDERYNSIKNKIDSEFESLLLAKYGTLLGLTQDKWSLESIESEFSRIMKSENKTDIDFLVLKQTIRSNQSDFKSAIEFLKTLAEKKETKQFIKDLDKIKESGVTQNSAAATPLTPREAAVNPSLLVSEIPPLSVLENKFQVMSNDNFETIKSKRQIFLDNLEQQRKSYLLEMNNYILGDTKPTFNSIERLEKEFNSAKNEIDSKYKSLLLAKYGTLLGLTKDKWSLESIESEFSRIMKSENKTDIDFLVLKQTIRSNQSDFKSDIEFLKTLAEKKETEQFLQDLDKTKETSDEAAANMTQTTPTDLDFDFLNKKQPEAATPSTDQQATESESIDLLSKKELVAERQAPNVATTSTNSSQSQSTPDVETLLIDLEKRVNNLKSNDNFYGNDYKEMSVISQKIKDLKNNVNGKQPNSPINAEIQSVTERVAKLEEIAKNMTAEINSTDEDKKKGLFSRIGRIGSKISTALTFTEHKSRAQKIQPQSIELGQASIGLESEVKPSASTPRNDTPDKSKKALELILKKITLPSQEWTYDIKPHDKELGAFVIKHTITDKDNPTHSHSPSQHDITVFKDRVSASPEGTKEIQKYKAQVMFEAYKANVSNELPIKINFPADRTNCKPMIEELTRLVDEHNKNLADPEKTISLRQQ